MRLLGHRPRIVVVKLKAGDQDSDTLPKPEEEGNLPVVDPDVLGALVREVGGEEPARTEVSHEIDATVYTVDREAAAYPCAFFPILQFRKRGLPHTLSSIFDKRF